MIKLDILMGHVQLMRAPPRIEGDTLITRGRSITYDRYGNVTKDETYDLLAVTGWESTWWMWGAPPPPPKPKTWWQRLRDCLC